MDNYTPANLLLLLVILFNFFLLGSSRLGACIRTVAIQGGILSLLPLFLHGFSGHSLILAGGAFLLKGLAIPFLLLRAIRQVQIKREMEPLIGYVPTLLLGTLATGFLMLITRRKAITQALGYLIFENGVFIFGMLLAEAMPLMVEAGVLLDLLVAVFVMGIVMHQINREFSSMNIGQLSSLRE